MRRGWTLLTALLLSTVVLTGTAEASAHNSKPTRPTKAKSSTKSTKTSNASKHGIKLSGVKAKPATSTATRRPVMLLPPSIQGTAAEGDTLTALVGYWLYETKYQYQWSRCNAGGTTCSAISGATTRSYALGSAVAGDSLKVTIVATNSVGSTSATSSATAAVPVPPPPAPASTSSPVISGTVGVGGLLSASVGSWSNDPTSFSYQWSDCDGSGADCTAIGGATSSTYTVQTTDENDTIEVTVTATNAGGSGTATSSPTAAVPTPPPPAPVNTSGPAISGTAAVGNTLAASQGSWSNNPTSFSYQWDDCDGSGANCAAIGGATSSTYVVQTSDEGQTLSVTVTAANAGGSAAVASAATSVVAVPAPVNSALPAISGTAVAGDTLSASRGSWSNSPSSFSYQWSDCNSSGANCTAITGATSSSYTVQPTDEGDTVEVTVTASNAGGSSTAVSAPTATIAVPAPVNSALPAIAGTAAVGDALSASRGSWSNSPSSFSYQWSDCDSSGANCTAISGATSSSYTVQPTDEGDTLEVTVTAGNAEGSSNAVSAPTATIAVPAPVNSALPAITGTAAVGDTLSASEGSWLNSPSSFSYQWSDCDGSGANCTAISGATSSSYTVQTSDENDTLEATVTAANGGGSVSAVSAPTSPIATPAATPVETAAPAIIGIPLVGDGLAVSSPGSWSNAPSSYAYQWEDCNSSGASCAPITGQIYATYVVALTDESHEIRLRVTATNSVGSTAAMSNATGMVSGPGASSPPANSAVPALSGTAAVGGTLSASEGSWSNSPTSYAYQWSDCNGSGASCTSISGATSSSYTVQTSDEGHTIEATVTAANSAGSASATSSPSATIATPPTSAPVNTGAPTVTGTAAVGDSLSAGNGSWSNSPTSYTDKWEDCNSAGASCSAISGASSSTYTVQTSDEGSTIEVAVTASNSVGSASASSSATAVVATPGSGTGSTGTCSSPCMSLPTISGSAVEGSTLTGSTGSWSDSPGEYTYQWMDCNSSGASCTDAAGGFNVTSYVVQPSDAGHTIELSIKALTPSGGTSAVSASTPVVASGGPSDSVLPAVSGSAVAGDTLSASQGTWSGSGLTFAYQWSDCIVGGGNCSVISGATGSSYTVQSSDEGFAVEVTVTASNGSGSEAVSSAVTAAVPVPPSNIDVAISGLAVLGSTLTVRDHWSGSGLALSYQWLDCSSSGGSCSNIAGATGATYVVAAADETHAIEVKVSASNGGGSVSATSSATAVIQSPVGSGTPASTGAPVVSGSPGEGDPLAVTVGTWSGVPTSYSFQWQDCNSSGASCSNVESGTGTSYVYVPTSKDVGDTLRVEVTATNSSGSASATSAATAGVTALGAASNGGLTIVGDQLVNDAGAVVVPHGVDRSGSEYACWQFDAISDGPIDAPATAAMSTWNINMVRVQLNEDCWLGIDGVPANVSGQNYVNAIKAWVNILHEYGIYAYISLMSGHPGSEAPDNNEPNAPDEDHSPLFWEQLASTFKNDPNVILAPQSELSSSGVDWNCYINGCSNEAASPNTTAGPFDGDATCYSSSSLYCGYYYQSAGMKQAVEIMRDAGYNGPIGIPCVNWADECSSYDGEGTLGGTWQSEVPSIDPDHQVMAEIHSYTNGSVCASPGCYNATLSPILAAGYPVIFGELGENGDCAADSGGVAGVMPWAVSNGVGWLSFAWDVYGFCTLISSYEPPTPWGGAGDYGAYVQALDQSLPG